MRILILLIALTLSFSVTAQEKTPGNRALKNKSTNRGPIRQKTHFDKSGGKGRPINSNGTRHRWSFYLPLFGKTKDGFSVDTYRTRTNKKKGIK